MANPGTAVAKLWNVQSEEKIANSGAVRKQEEVQTRFKETEFTKILTENKFEGAAIETGLITAPNKLATGATTMASLVTNLSNLVGAAGTTSNQGMVTAFISRPSSMVTASTNISQIQKPVVVAPTQPLLLPKPSVSKQVPSTPPKVAFTPNPSVLTSPILASPGKTWPVGSPVNRKRLQPEFDLDQIEAKRKRTPNRCGTEKVGKGLRHFSMKVCEKVQHKGITSYNEVADELVQEFSEQSMKNPIQNTDQSYDQKNIRRRVYDALNVLMAMNIISKEKKEIKWVGLPTNSAQECKHLEEQKTERIERIRQKQQQLKELLVQQIAFKNLVERNKHLEKKNGSPPPNACINLPFIIVNTSKKTVIDCSISSDKSEYLFNFDEAFEIHDDIEVLKRMGLSFGLEKGECIDKNLKAARTMVPKALESYVLQMANGTYGDMELIDVEKLRQPVSPLATPLMTGQSATTTVSSGSSKHKITTTRKKKTVNSRIVSQQQQQVLLKASLPTPDSDTDNDGDDENSSVGVN